LPGTLRSPHAPSRAERKLRAGLTRRRRRAERRIRPPEGPLRCPGAEDKPPEASEAPAREAN